MNQAWRRWMAGVGAAAGLLGAGCNPAITTHETPPVQTRAELVSFKGNTACADLEQYLEDTAVQQMRTQMEAQRDQVPSWGWWGSWDTRGGIDLLGGPPVLSAAGGEKAGQAAPTNYTTTNNQVAGVDEADFVKNDGTRIFVLSGQTLYAMKSGPAADLAVVGKTNIEGWPRELFLDGTNRAVVFSSVFKPYPLQPELARCVGLSCGYYSSNTTKMTVLEVSDLAKPKVVHEYYLPGGYESARKVGTSVRVVLRDGFRYPAMVKFWPDYDAYQNLWLPTNKDKLIAKYNELISANETFIRAQTLSDWLPAGSAVIGGQTFAMPQACSSFSKVNAPTRLGVVTVATLNLTAPGPDIHRSSILGESGEVYASAKNLYVATRHWWWWPRPGQTDTTYIHKFDISQPDAAHYVASGAVEGHIVDQFSMDENSKGHFRVATTLSRRVVDPKNRDNWWGILETTNRLTVLQESSGVLTLLGQSEDVAKDERIFSSRFVEDTAYVVTFRQVDPLFTFDLSDPTHPKKVGELKIPGFSSYIHPIDAKPLLTIGTYIPEDPNAPWQERSLQRSLFDVSDLKNPKQTFTQKVGTASSWSEAQAEHKAFNYFPAKKLLAIPFYDWSYNYRDDTEYWNSFTSDLRVYEVDPAKGFTPKGALSMKDVYQTVHSFNWTYYWMPNVRRSVMADDFVYGISDAAVRVANIADLSTPIATAAFDPYVEK
jgi:hypothetical protein